MRFYVRVYMSLHYRIDFIQPHLFALHLFFSKHSDRSQGPCRGPGAIWGHLELLGDVWDHLEPSGDIWSHLEPSGTMWSHLEPSGDIWVRKYMHFHMRLHEMLRILDKRANYIHFHITIHEMFKIRYNTKGNTYISIQHYMKC